MKPVFQTLFGVGTGNCFAACVASVLELPLEDVPNFCVDYPEPQDWFAPFKAWCAARGVLTLPFVLDGLESFGGLLAMTRLECPELPYILCGQIQVGDVVGGHAVVGRCGSVVHDPNPKHNHAERNPFTSYEMVLFLVKDPVPLTDAHRLAVFQELVAYQYRNGITHMDQAMYAFEREVKARMGVVS